MDTFLRNKIHLELDKLHKDKLIDLADLSSTIEHLEENVASLTRIWKSASSGSKAVRESNAKSDFYKMHFYTVCEYLTSSTPGPIEEILEINNKGLANAPQDSALFTALYLLRVEILLRNPLYVSAALNCLTSYKPEYENQNFKIIQMCLHLRALLTLEHKQEAYEKALELEQFLASIKCFSEKKLPLEDEVKSNICDDSFDLTKIIDFRSKETIEQAKDFFHEVTSQQEEEEGEENQEDVEHPPREPFGYSVDNVEEGFEITVPTPEEQEVAVESEGILQNSSENPNFLYHGVNIMKTDFGREMRATQSFEPEDLIMDESAYCEIQPLTEQYKSCNRCFKSVLFEPVVPCKSCCEVLYCSEECRHDDQFKYSHTHECGLIGWISSRSHFYAFRQLLLYTPNCVDVIENGLRNPNPNDILSIPYSMEDYMHDDEMKNAKISFEMENYRAVTRFYQAQRSLSVPFDRNHNYSDKIMAAIELTFVALGEMSPEDFETIEKTTYYRLINWMFQMMLRYVVNNFSTDRNGTAICLISSMFNHNCDCNAYWRFENGRVRIRAYKEIQAGEPITIDYGTSSKMTYEERWIKMMNYYFQCRCKNCQVDYRSVPTVRCDKCPGPVPMPLSMFKEVEEKDIPSQDRFSCLTCGEPSSTAVKKLSQVRAVWREFSVATETVKYLTKPESRDSLINSLYQYFSEVHVLLHPTCNFWLEFVFRMAQMYHCNNYTQRALLLGSIYTHPQMEQSWTENGSELMIIKNPFLDQEPCFTLKTDPIGENYMLNIRHLMFWTDVYASQAATLEEAGCIELNRFYARLAALLDLAIDKSTTLAEKFKEESKDFNANTTETLTKIFETFRDTKYRELKKLCDEYPKLVIEE